MLLGGEMKKILLLMVFLLIPIALAQDLEISIVSYTSETGSARLRIYNPTDINYNDLKYSIDGQEERDIVQRLAAKTAISVFPTIPPGTHELAFTSSNGLSFQQEINFGSTEQQITDQKAALEEYNKKLLEKVKPQIDEELIKQQEAKESRPYVLIAVILAVLIVIAYYIFKKIRK